LLFGDPLAQGVLDPPLSDTSEVLLSAACAFSCSPSSLSTYFSTIRCRIPSSTKGGKAAAINTLQGGAERLRPGSDRGRAEAASPATGVRMARRSSSASHSRRPIGPLTISRSSQVVYAPKTASTNSSGPSAGPFRGVSVAVDSSSVDFCSSVRSCLSPSVPSWFVETAGFVCSSAPVAVDPWGNDSSDKTLVCS
jgi:hypothetical protein